MIDLRAYAKINLTLDVLGVRKDGYHEIDSIVQTIDLHDTLVFKHSRGMEITVDGFRVPTDERNLVWKACVSMLNQYGLPGGLSVSIVKRVPTQAGMGGGSSDAAAALLGTAKLFGIEPDAQVLLDLAANLGSDVPFFLTGGTARMKGRGEEIEPLPDAPKLDLVIVWPRFGVSTAQAYRLLDERTGLGARATNKALAALQSGNIDALCVAMSNDFEDVVLPQRKEFEEIKSNMRQLGAVTTLLSGSGSAVFGIMSSTKLASEAAEVLRQRFGYAWAAAFIGRDSYGDQGFKKC